MKVALCYDRVNKFGGAERVLQALHEIWPDAPVFTLTYSPDGAKWADGWDIHTSFLQKLPLIGKRHELFPPLAPVAWEQMRFDGYDVVISVTSAEAKSILVSPRTIHVCYCLTPTRYFWSGFYDYLISPGFGWLNGIVKKVFPFFAYTLRVQDYIHAQRPDHMIGISDEVCRRIKKYYRRDSVKIYPPVEIKGNLSARKKGEYFLVVSRLVPYKRIDLVIEAFNSLGWPLIVVGTGSEEARLKGMARQNIQFKGFVADEELELLYNKAVALVFPTLEDFGIVPVEAQARGLPVVAFRAGGVLETVIEGKTGLFFDKQSSESLVNLLHSVVAETDFASIVDYFSSFKSEDCQANAEKFGKSIFQNSLKSLVEEKYAEYMKRKSKVV